MVRTRPVPMVVLALLAGSVLVVAGQGGRGQRQFGPATTRSMYKVGGTRVGMSAFPKVDYPQLKPLVGAGKGSATKDERDPKGRLMRRVPQGQGDYELYPEGIDNDGDGRLNEDGIGGLDLHRN